LNSNFFEDVLLDFNFSLEKFVMMLNKNDIFYIFLDKNKSLDLSENYKNLIYNERYEILIKNNSNNQIDEENIYSFPNKNNIAFNSHVKKLFNMIDLLSVKMKFFTNVFYSFELEESKVSYLYKFLSLNFSSHHNLYF
jgi:hypothetical protein